MFDVILDLGCGRNKCPGAIGLDVEKLPGIDIVHDLNKFPYPFESNTFDRVILKHVIEHVDDVVKVMDEIFRIGKPNAKVEIHTPHFSSLNSYADPTHRHHFSLFLFDFFCGGTSYDYVAGAKYKLIKRRVSFWPVVDTVPWLSYRLLGIRRLAEHHPHFYERFLCFLFPMREFSVELQIMKPAGIKSVG